MTCWWHNWNSMSHFVLSSDSCLIFQSVIILLKVLKCFLFYLPDITIFLQWKRKGNYSYEQQLKYLHVLDIILLPNLHWFNSLVFKTSFTNLWKECRGFNWLQRSFCLLKYSRSDSKENKIKSYWISNIYTGHWKGIGIIVHWPKPFWLWYTFPSQSYHLAASREEIWSVYCGDPKERLLINFYL